MTDRWKWILRNLQPHRTAAQRWIGGIASDRFPEDELDDLMQEAFLKALKYADRELCNPRGLLQVIARDLLRDELKRRRFLNPSSLDDIEDIADPSPGPDVVLADQRELYVALFLIQDLPELTRNIFILRRFEGLTARETAQRLNVTEVRVARRMNWVLERLKVACPGRDTVLGHTLSRRASSPTPSPSRREHKRTVQLALKINLSFTSGRPKK